MGYTHLTEEQLEQIAASGLDVSDIDLSEVSAISVGAQEEVENDD